MGVECSFVVIGGSMGALKALMGIMGSMCGSIDFAMAAVLHRYPESNTDISDLLIPIFSKVMEVDDKQNIECGYLYICPADYHLYVEHDQYFSLSKDAKVNYSRPSIDLLFESAARVYGEHLTAILLTGGNADGAKGLGAVHRHGGVVIVQNPEHADAVAMPQAGLLEVPAALVLELEDIGQYLRDLTQTGGLQQ